MTEIDPLEFEVPRDRDGEGVDYGRVRVRGCLRKRCKWIEPSWDQTFHPGSIHPSPHRRRLVDEMLYGILKGWSAEQCMQFGWATGALAAASTNDYGAPADEDQVWYFWKGNARVQR